MKKNVNLALPRYGGENLVSTSPSGGPDYPSLHLTGKEELNLPESGTITFEYTLRSETSAKNPDGSHRYDCMLDMKNLVSVKPKRDERPSKRDTSTEENLDKLMAEKEKESDSASEEGY